MAKAGLSVRRRNQAFWAGYTFGGLSTPGNGSSYAVLPIVQCHSTLACAGGDTSFQCLQGYADTRCSHEPTARIPFGSSAREFLRNSLPRGFGRRCGACDVGYYGLSGRCHECGSEWAVLFLSRVLPALAILAATAFLFYGGKSDLLKAHR